MESPVIGQIKKKKDSLIFHRESCSVFSLVTDMI